MGDGALLSFTLWFGLGDIEAMSQTMSLVCYFKVLISENPGDFPVDFFRNEL